MRGDLLDLRDAPGTVLAGMAVVQTIGIGQEDEQVCATAVDHQCGELVVVPEAQLLGRNRVVLVDEWHDALLDQRLERVARVEEALALRQAQVR